MFFSALPDVDQRDDAQRSAAAPDSYHANKMMRKHCIFIDILNLFSYFYSKVSFLCYFPNLTQFIFVHCDFANLVCSCEF